MIDLDKSKILEDISKQLDISPTMYQLAVDRYTAVSKYLISKGLDANFYPQGSFRLGTVTRPIKNGVESEYDIDLVCQVNIDKNETNPTLIKNAVGNLLKQHATYKGILDAEGSRCWTLLYAEKDEIGFHLDILPSVNEGSEIIQDLINLHKIRPELASSAIAITEKNVNSYTWFSSNPRGYADWFEEINEPFFRLIEKSAKTLIFESNRSIYSSIDEVPPQLVRTPLQRVIQILKRHRDLRFNGHVLEEDKPISMIITTLTASIVKNDGCSTNDIFALLNHIVNRLNDYAELINNSNAKIAYAQNAVIKRNVTTKKWFIPNPVNPNENFADRWHENNDRKAKAFFDWVKWVSSDLIASLNNPDFDFNSLSNSFGSDVVRKVTENHKKSNLSYKAPAAIIPAVSISSPGKPWRR